MGLEDVPRCQHVKTNGTQCGSPALRRRRLCFFHDRIRNQRIADNKSLIRFPLPLLEDANAVQMALMQVIQRLGSGTMDPKTAGLMLYALQTASINLRYTDFEAAKATDVVIDRDTVAATCLNGPQWFKEDFDLDASEEDADVDEDENENEDEDEDEGENEEATAHNAEDLTPSATSKADTHPAAAENKQKRIGPEEARKPVQGVVREWLAETALQKSP